MLLLLGFIITSERLPVRAWLSKNLEALALKHADNHVDRSFKDSNGVALLGWLDL